MKRILVVEDVAETQHWLAGIATEAFGEVTVARAATLRQALTFVERETFDIALIDLGLPDGSGIDILRSIRRGNADTLCVVTTVMADDASIVAALSAGANGYLLKEQTPERIAGQLRQLAEGVPALSPSIARRIMEHFRYTGPADNSEDSLTGREREVLALIGRGLRNGEVAQQLAMAESTVATHLKSIYRKLGITSRAEASWHAARLGLSPGGNQGRT